MLGSRRYGAPRSYNPDAGTGKMKEGGRVFLEPGLAQRPNLRLKMASVEQDIIGNQSRGSPSPAQRLV